MPINLEDLSVLAYANGFTLWHLRTSADLAGLCSSGDLQTAADMLRPGDLVIASGGDGGLAAAGLLIVADISPDGVAARPLLSGGSVGSP